MVEKKINGDTTDIFVSICNRSVVVVEERTKDGIALTKTYVPLSHWESINDAVSELKRVLCN